MSKVIKGYKVDPHYIHQIYLEEVDEKEEEEVLETIESEVEVESTEAEIKEEEYVDPAILECERKIEEMMEAAHEKAAQILQEAHDLALIQANEIKEEAYQVGYNEGNEQRFHELWEELGSVESYISEMVSQHQDRYNEYMRNVDIECKLLAVSIAEKVLMKKIEIDENELFTMIEEGIKNLKKFKYGEIEISKQCISFVETLQGNLRDAGYENFTIKQVNGDKGTCVLTTDSQRVDMSISKQLENIIKMIKG